MIYDTSILQAAIIGLQAERDRIDQAMAKLRQILPGGGGGYAKSSVTPRKRKGMSAATRRKMAAAQKKRWAAYRAGKSAA